MLLNDDQTALLAAARRFSRERLLPAYQLREQQGKMDRTVLREMGQLGLLVSISRRNMVVSASTA